MLSLPATVVTPRICNSGDFSASNSAIESSWGGMTKSVSKMTFCTAFCKEAGWPDAAGHHSASAIAMTRERFTFHLLISAANMS